ncbi:MAG: DUF166 family protein [Caldilineales bacterium]
MRILAVITGDYGRRHATNVREHAPAGWSLAEWLAPTNLPLFIDYPEDWVPADLPPADLILAFQEHKGVAELIPDVCAVTGARAVIAPVDSEAWLPRGLARQLRGWLADDGVACVTPKPLCSLTERDYLVTRRQRERYDNPLIAGFARHFGQPNLRIDVDPETRLMRAEAAVLRDACCGCASHVARRAGRRPGRRRREFEGGDAAPSLPCLASMGIDPDFSDTLSKNLRQPASDNVAEQVKPFKRVTHRPAN